MTGNEVVGIVVNLYDSLVELDPEQLTTVKPALAKSWDISPDGKTLPFICATTSSFTPAPR